MPRTARRGRLLHTPTPPTLTWTLTMHMCTTSSSTHINDIASHCTPARQSATTTLRACAALSMPCLQHQRRSNIDRNTTSHSVTASCISAISVRVWDGLWLMEARKSFTVFVSARDLRDDAAAATALRTASAAAGSCWFATSLALCDLGESLL